MWMVAGPPKLGGVLPRSVWLATGLRWDAGGVQHFRDRDLPLVEADVTVSPKRGNVAIKLGVYLLELARKRVEVASRLSVQDVLRPLPAVDFFPGGSRPRESPPPSR